MTDKDLNIVNKNIGHYESPAHPPAYRPFPIDALPEPARSFVTTGATAKGCDSSYIALPLLSMLGTCIGSSRSIRLKRSWDEPPIIWTAIVGESGTMKTPALRQVLRPLRDVQGKMLKQYEEAQTQYKAELSQYESELAEWKKSKKSEPPVKPQEPTRKRVMVSDTTVEALAPILLDNPRGLLMACDELAGWIGSFDRYSSGGKGSDAPHWLSMHGGDSIIVDRKTGEPPTIFVPRAAVGVTGGIQPGIMRRVLGAEHRESGLAARLLMAMPPRIPKRWTDQDTPEQVETDLAQLVERLLALEPAYNAEGEPCPFSVGLTPQAKQLWIEYYNAHAQEQAELNGDLAAVWSKLEGYAARLGLVVHCVRQVSGEVVGEAVDEVSIRAGIALARWFGNEAKRIYAVLDENQADEKRRELVEWIRGKGGRVAARDVARGPREYRNKTKDAKAALDDLAEVGLGRWEHAPASKAGGNPARRFVLTAPKPEPSSLPQMKAKATAATMTEHASTGAPDVVVSPSPVSPYAKPKSDMTSSAPTDMTTPIADQVNAAVQLAGQADADADRPELWNKPPEAKPSSDLQCFNH